MKIYAASNYQSYSKANPQVKNSSISFGIVEKSAKPLLSKMGYGIFTRNSYEARLVLGIKGFILYGVDGKLKCEIKPSEEQYEKHKAEIDALRKVLKEADNVIPNEQTLDGFLTAFARIFPLAYPPERSREYQSGQDDHLYF